MTREPRRSPLRERRGFFVAVGELPAGVVPCTCVVTSPHDPSRHRTSRSSADARSRTRRNRSADRRRARGRRGTRRVSRRPGCPAIPRGSTSAATSRSGITSRSRRVFRRMAEESVVVPGPVTEALGTAARDAASCSSSASLNASTPVRHTARCTTAAAHIRRRRRVCSTTIASSCRPTPSEWCGASAMRTGSRPSRPRSDASARSCAGNTGCRSPARRCTIRVRTFTSRSGRPRTRCMQVASRHYAFEGRCFVLAAGSLMRASALPPELEPHASKVRSSGDWVLRGGSAIVGPDGRYIVEPCFDRPELIVSDIDLGRVREERMTLDVSGHYHRPELLRLEIDRSTRR